jgi:hypothetical protein
MAKTQETTAGGIGRDLAGELAKFISFVIRLVLQLLQLPFQEGRAVFHTPAFPGLAKFALLVGTQ